MSRSEGVGGVVTAEAATDERQRTLGRMKPRPDEQRHIFTSLIGCTVIISKTQARIFNYWVHYGIVPEGTLNKEKLPEIIFNL